LEKKKHVIVGCGTAALSALKRMRQNNAADDIEVVSMEPHLPYSPTSLPYLISGKIQESEISMVTESFFDRMRAVWARGRGKRVERLDTGKSQVIYESGEREAYDSLLIATGSEPVVPSIPGLKQEEALQLRTLDHARALIDKIKGTRTAIILGAGLIGMHVAQCLAEKGMKVKVVEMQPRILPSYFDADASPMIQRVLEQHGITFFVNKQVAEVYSKKGFVGVALKGGDALEADLLLVATGVRPRTSLVNGSGIEVDNGILVDRQMRTNVSNVFAAGDVAAAKSFFTGKHGLNPILPSAAEQGNVAGSNMVGEVKEYEGWLPMNTFNFFGHRAVSVGETTPVEGDEVLAEANGKKETYRKLIYRQGKLVGATFLSTDVDAGVFQYLVRKRVEISQYKNSLLALPRETSLWLMREAERKETVSIED